MFAPIASESLAVPDLPSVRVLRNTEEYSKPASALGLARLESIAAQDGVIDEGERAYFRALKLPPDLAQRRDAFLAGANAPGGPRNPALEWYAQRDHHFATRVALVLHYGHPGDLLLFRTGPHDRAAADQTDYQAHGPWDHVALMLENHLLVEANWSEGVALSTVAASVAKHSSRMRSCEMLVTRPFLPMTTGQIQRISELAIAASGKPFNVLPLIGEQDSPDVSCSSALWELCRGAEANLPDRKHWFYRHAVSPGDFVQQPVVLIEADGTTADPAGEPDLRLGPNGWLGFLLRGVDRVVDVFPGFLGFMRQQAKGIVDGEHDESGQTLIP